MLSIHSTYKLPLKLETAFQLLDPDALLWSESLRAMFYIIFVCKIAQMSAEENKYVWDLPHWYSKLD